MKTIADIAGNNAAHQLTSNADIYATAVYLGATGGPARVGDANVGASRGASIEASSIFTLPPKPFAQGTYQLSAIYVYIPIGTTLSITYDND